MMGQREDVRASLLMGDSRDGCARRKVADDVKRAVVDGSAAVAWAAYRGLPEAAATHAQEQATAASAVVLASDLRAPEVRWRADECDPPEMATELATARDMAMAALCTCSGTAPDANGETDQVVDPACPMCGDGPALDEFVGHRKTRAEVRAPMVSENRQGWRGRLANVERLLAQAKVGRSGDQEVDEALAEVRAMIDEAGVE